MSGPRVLILGGGISGLSLAHFLRQTSKAQCTLLEKSNRVGGWIRTTKKQGLVIEHGPASYFARRGEDTIGLMHELGLQDQLVLADKAAKQRYIWNEKQGKLQHISLMGLAFKPWLIAGFLKDLVAAQPSPDPDETIYSFISRRFNRRMAEELVDPAVAGIYGGDIRKLSMRSCFPVQFEAAQHGSLLRPSKKAPKPTAGKAPSSVPPALLRSIQMSGSFSFQDGMEALPLALQQSLTSQGDAVRLRLGSEVVSLSSVPDDPTGQCGIRAVIQHDGDQQTTEDFDFVYSTLPTYSLASILEHSQALASSSSSAPASDALSSLIDSLRSIHYASMYICHLAYDSALPPPASASFGFLVPSSAKRPVLGAQFLSSIFPARNHGSGTHLRMLLGGDRQPDLISQAPESITALSRQAVGWSLGQPSLAELEPAMTEVSLAKQCIPQFYLGHADTVSKIKQLSETQFGGRLVVLGAAINGVAMNECIASAKRAAREFAMTSQH